jgi:hypothetical protein
MNHIVTFGNCQADGLAKLMRMVLPDRGYEVEFLSSNARTGGMQSADEILSTIRRSSVLIFQPLGERHGPLSEPGIRAASTDCTAVLSFPHIFNSGIAGLSHAPYHDGGKPFGAIYGEEKVLDLLRGGATRGEVVDAYLAGAIDFELPERFGSCLTEMLRREEATDIRVGAYIAENFRAERLFVTHNHPTTALLAEMCVQVAAYAGLPIDLEALRSIEDQNVGGGRTDQAPVSPHDAKALGYRFAPDPIWEEIGPRLIGKIADAFEVEGPARADDPRKLPAARR